MSRFAKGCKPDRVDVRDYPFHVTEPRLSLARLAPMPPRVSLRNQMSPVRDQANLGACTGFGLCGLMESLLLAASLPVAELSPLFVYYLERESEDDIPVDGGAMIRTGLNVLLKVGAAPEADDPYIPSRFTDLPSDQALNDARAYRIGNYYRCFTLRQVKRSLYFGHPVVLGIEVFESFESDASIASGTVPMPEPGERLLGGHCILGCSYDDATERIEFKNSWGVDVGDKGYFSLPYSYWDQPGVGQDARVSDSWTAVLPAPVP